MMAAIEANNKVMPKHPSKKKGATHYLFRNLSHMTKEKILQCFHVHITTSAQEA